jgi:hypothetical protein
MVIEDWPLGAIDTEPRPSGTVFVSNILTA